MPQGGAAVTVSSFSVFEKAVHRCSMLVGRQTTFYSFSRTRGCSDPRETLNAFVLFPDRLLTKVRVVPLVKEELGPDSLYDNVPGIHGAGAAHQCGQNGIGGKDIPLRFCQLQRGQNREKSEDTLRSNCPLTQRGELSPPHPHRTRVHTAGELLLAVLILGHCVRSSLSTHHVPASTDNALSSSPQWHVVSAFPHFTDKKAKAPER